MSSKNDVNMNLENKTKLLKAENKLKAESEFLLHEKKNTDTPQNISTLEEAEEEVKNSSINLRSLADSRLDKKESPNNNSENISRLEQAERELKNSSIEFKSLLEKLDARLNEKRIASERRIEELERERIRSEKAIANKSKLLEELKNKKEQEKMSQNEAAAIQLRIQAETEEKERLMREQQEADRLLQEQQEADRLLQEQQEAELLLKANNVHSPPIMSQEESKVAAAERISNIMDIVIAAQITALNLSEAYRKKLNDQKAFMSSFRREDEEKLIKDYLKIVNINDDVIRSQIIELSSEGKNVKNPSGIIFIYPSLFLSVEELDLYSSVNNDYEKTKRYMSGLFNLLVNENVFFIHTNSLGDKKMLCFFEGYIKLFIDDDRRMNMDEAQIELNANKMIKEHIMGGIPDDMNLDYKLDQPISPGDTNRANIRDMLEECILQKTHDILSSMKQEKRLKRSLEREPSMLISHQTGGDCWNYSVCRVIVRLICNVLDIADQNIPECNTLYDALSKFDVKVARRDCSAAPRPNEENSPDYVKLLIYVFFVYHGYAKFAVCNTFTESGKGVKENKIKLNGKLAARALDFFVKTILANDNLNDEFPAYLDNLWFENVTKIRSNLKIELEAVLLPLLNEFSHITNNSSSLKSYPSFLNNDLVNPKTFSMKDLTKDEFMKGIETINFILSKGLYVVISVQLGPKKSPYFETLSKYKNEPGAFRPYAKKITLGNIQKEEGDAAEILRIKRENSAAIGGHAMVITKYDIEDSGKKRFVYSVRNSWGSQWGDNGTIQLFPNELHALRSRFDWIEPNDLDVVIKQPRNPKQIQIIPYQEIVG